MSNVLMHGTDLVVYSSVLLRIISSRNLRSLSWWVIVRFRSDTRLHAEDLFDHSARRIPPIFGTLPGLVWLPASIEKTASSKQEDEVVDVAKEEEAEPSQIQRGS